MSTVFSAHCETDDSDGPLLKRAAGGPYLIDEDAWAEWLIKHEYHEIVLKTEG